MMMKDDNELVYEVVHGSISSFEVLVDRYQKTVKKVRSRLFIAREQIRKGLIAN